MIRSFKYRLYPTPEQAETLTQWMGVCRLIYNVALHQRDTQWRQYFANTGKRITCFGQINELTAVREQFDWVRAVPRMMCEAALRDLDRAFQGFFSGKTGFPTPRSRGVHDTLRIKGRETRVEKINDRWGAVAVPKLGLVRFRSTRPVLGNLRFVTIKVRAGQWFATMACEIEHVGAVASVGSVGIDRGVANTLTLSTGEKLSVPPSLAAIERRQRRAKRVLTRRVRGSNRYAKQRRRAALLSLRCANIRLDWHHRTTTDLARRFGVVAVEALQVQNMTARGKFKRGINRAILNQGWGMFTQLLAYKLEERGGTLLTVDPAYTSQTCSSCGTIDAESRESQAVFRCRHCGLEAHADYNAAINILRRSTPATLVEVAHWGTDEARTNNHSAQLAA